MSLIPRVGRSSPGTRMLYVCIYAILSLGALTMVYPFLVMLSGSLKTNVDQSDFDVVPRFVYDDRVLYRKHLECKYNNSIASYRLCTRSAVYEFGSIRVPARPAPGAVADWRVFEGSFGRGSGWYELGYATHMGDRLMLRKHREFLTRLRRACGDDLDELRTRFECPVENWTGVVMPLERVTERRYLWTGGPLEREFQLFKAEQPLWFRLYPSLDARFARDCVEPAFGRDLARLNAETGLALGSFADVTLAARVPTGPLRAVWERFVRDELNLQFVRVDAIARPLFGQFLERRYEGDIRRVNQRYGSAFERFDQVDFPTELLCASQRLVDWAEFLRVVPVEHLFLVTPEIEFRSFLAARYGGDLSALRKAHGLDYASLERVPLPAEQVDYADFLAHRGEIRREFLTANYRQVLDYILFHGRGLFNTVVYCLLAVLGALTVNPLAAYALSRYKLRSGHKVLIFCMATMAFPPAVSMIPNFLLLKNLDMLNTFAALVLPGLANGFNIFLLKGFFDSIPRELFESAELDGAGEWVMFRHITLAMSKPILAVVALSAFTAAYGNFMFAFVLCPDEKMWTLMVFLYQLQINGHMGLTFAALIVAALPTLLVFVLCQQVIMRGIAVPVEK